MATKTKATKAIVGTVIAGVSAFVTPVLSTIINNQPVTPSVWATGAAALLVFGGIAFPSIYNTTNEPISSQ